jgi:CheY-like chemotaxis protein
LGKALAERPAPSGPLWRGSPTQQLLQAQTFAVVAGMPGEKALNERLGKLQLTSKVVPVKDIGEGVQAVVGRQANVFFADRSILLDAAKRSPASGDLVVLDRRFTLAPVAIALRRGDEDARLAVDRALSRLYAAPEFRAAYAKWFGEPDEQTSRATRVAWVITALARVIYIVDPDASVREGLGRLVESHGFEARPCDCREFLRQAPQGAGACALLDLSSQELGHAALRSQFRALSALLPVIALSVRDDAATRSLARELGARAFFRKPVDAAALLDSIDWLAPQDSQSKPH